MIELLAVVGIIAALIAILLPTLRAARESAKLVTCASNLRQVVALMHVYAQQNQGRLPVRAYVLQDWSGSLVAGGDQVFRCPADDTERRDLGAPATPRSYGVNCGPYVSIDKPGRRAPWPTVADARPERLAKIPNRIILVGDNHGQFAQSAAYVGFAEAEGLDGVAWGTHRPKRGRGDNYGFVDGHVDYRLKSDLDELALDLALDPTNQADGGPLDPWKWR